MTLPKQNVSFPEVAIIRKGTPKQKIVKDGREMEIQGKDLNNRFRLHFLPGTDSARAAWNVNHVKEAVKYDPSKFVISEGHEFTRLRVIVPTSNIWAAVNDDGAVNEAYNAGRRIARADDEKYIEYRDPNNKWEKIVKNGEPFKKFSVGDKITYERNGRKFEIPVKTNVRLRLVAADMIEQGQLVQFTLKTTSWYDWQNIKNQLAGIQGIADAVNNGNAAGVPFEIYRQEGEIVWNKPDGEAQRIKKWLINIQPDPEWVKSAFARMSQFALTGGAIAGALMPQSQIQGTVEPTEDDDDEVDAEEIKELDPEEIYKQAAETIVPVKDKGEKFMSELTSEQLQYIIDNGKKPNLIESAKVVLKHDFGMESV